MRRHLLMALVMALALMIQLAPNAAAHGVRWEDRNQTVRPEREMEIRSVVQSHRREPSGDYVSLTVQTFEDFDNVRLDAEDHWALMIAFDIDSDDLFDRNLYVDAVPDASGGYTLYGEMRCCKQGTEPGDGPWALMPRSNGYVRVDRPTTDKVRVTFPESALRRSGVDRFRWTVRTVWRDRDEEAMCECGVNSFDYAPRRGMKRGHT